MALTTMSRVSLRTSMEFEVSRVPISLAYSVGLLLGYAPQAASGDADTILYVFTALCAAVFFASDVRDWTS